MYQFMEDGRFRQISPGFTRVSGGRKSGIYSSRKALLCQKKTLKYLKIAYFSHLKDYLIFFEKIDFRIKNGFKSIFNG